MIKHEQNMNKYEYRKIYSEDVMLPDKYFHPSFDLLCLANQKKIS
jgi:hypothetical protein